MSAQLLLDRLEFSTIKVEVTTELDSVQWDKSFPQIDFDFDGVTFLTRSALNYPPAEAKDPRHFALSYGLKVDSDKNSKSLLPYHVEIEATGFFRFLGGDEYVGVERFRAVRFSGYQILHGAIREMICNLTARGRHGLWQLPARDFRDVARERSEEDEQHRLLLLQKSPKKLAHANDAARPARKRTVKRGKP
jgi:hypothetical protein